MAKIIKPLTMQQVLGLKPKEHSYYKAVDNDGLYVEVRSTGKSWVYRTPQRKWISLGTIQSIGLAQARIAIAERKQTEPTSNLPIFKEASKGFILAHIPIWKNPKHIKQWSTTLEQFVFPVIGHKPVDQITATDVIQIMDTIGVRLETARRVRGRIKQIIDATWITKRTGTPYSNPADSLVIGTLKPALTKKIKRNHHKAISIKDAPNAFKELMAKRKQNVSYACLCFTILNACRSNEATGALWSEIKDDLWILPPEKMKSGKEHIIPLSTASIQILQERQAIDGNEGLIFPSPRGMILSDMSMLQSLKRSCGSTLTVHGFRSTFRDWGAEREFDSLALELCLAHTVGNETERAYRRTTLMDSRKKILEEWAQYLLSLVVHLHTQLTVYL